MKGIYYLAEGDCILMIKNHERDTTVWQGRRGPMRSEPCSFHGNELVGMIDYHEMPLMVFLISDSHYFIFHESQVTKHVDYGARQVSS